MRAFEMSGEPTRELPPAWKVLARERTGDEDQWDMVTYERNFDRLRVVVTEYPIDGMLRRRVSASSPMGRISLAQERAVRDLFLWPGVRVELPPPMVNPGVSWFVQNKKMAN